MDIKTFLGIVPAIISSASWSWYIRDIFRGTTKPHPYTWLIWTITQGTATTVMLASGAGWGALLFATSAVICAIIFVLSIRAGREYITTFDTVCLVLAALAFCFYFFLKSPVLSVALASFVDGIGYIPTWRKAYEAPDTETIMPYIVEGTSTITSIMALGAYSFVTMVYPLTLFVGNFVCVGIVMWGRRRLQNA